MANVLKNKRKTCIEWNVQSSVLNYRIVSETFLLQSKNCNLEFYTGSEYTGYAINRPSLSFKCNGQLQLPINIALRIVKNSNTYSITDITITNTNQKIWSCTTDYQLTDRNMIFELIFHTDYSTEDETETSEWLRSETSHLHLEALSKDFAKLLNDHSSSDVDVTCKDKTFKAHRIVLSARSEVLGRMLNSSMVEGTTGQIKVEDCQVPIFQSFLHYLYSGKVPVLSLESSIQLYEVSDKYGVFDLRKGCSDFLRNHLTDDKAYEILILADQHSDEEFRKSVVSYMIDRKIPQRDSHWSDFCKNYCKLAIEVMLLYIQKYCPK